MKKNVKNYFVSAMVLFSLVLKGQWYEVSAPIGDLCRTNGGICYAAGGGGTIRKSVDRGNSWVLLDTKVTGDFYSVFFVNDAEGFACGESGLLRTLDAGKNWSVLQVTDNPFYSVYFTDENTGYILNDLGGIFKTNDGGETWNSVNFTDGIGASTFDYFSQVYFINNQTGFVCMTAKKGDGGKIYRTANAGSTWEMILEDGRFVHFTDDQNGYAVKLSNIICRTSDGGKTWTELHLGILDYITTMRFSGKIGYALGAAGSILKTFDGGITWIIQKSGVHHGLSGVVFDESGFALAVGSNATILKTENGGAKWNIISLGPPSDASCEIGCFTSQTGYVLARNGSLVKTSDGGVTWKPVYFFSGEVMRDISFVNDQYGYAAGLYAKLWRTKDGGLNWEKIGVPTKANINKVFTLTQDEFFIVGDDDEFYKTKDGGLNWIQIMGVTKFSVETPGARTFHFLNDSVGFLININGLYYTSDRGETWKKWTYPNCNPCLDYGGQVLTHWGEYMFIADKFLWKSNDGGKTWIKMIQTFPFDTPLDCYFNDDENGYLLLPGNDFKKTVNGGTTFTRESFRSSNFNLSGLAFSGTYGLAMGEAGRIFIPFKMAGKYVGLPELKVGQKRRLMVHPNPSKGIFNITCLDCNEGTLIEIFDAVGKLVYKKNMVDPTIERLDLSMLPKGCYSLKVGAVFSRIICE